MLVHDLEYGLILLGRPTERDHHDDVLRAHLLADLPERLALEAARSAATPVSGVASPGTGRLDDSHDRTIRRALEVMVEAGCPEHDPGSKRWHPGPKDERILEA
ncbi:hypothetical protein [Natronobacterium haloterrestre]|uniref:hypothetical protein n=1 Tax=Natronobacterium haloterrestre TaxID=148448 RepID=UPI001FDF1329|nr:hypothetical protein [Halobiforma haloterrestris]